MFFICEYCQNIYVLILHNMNNLLEVCTGLVFLSNHVSSTLKLFLENNLILKIFFDPVKKIKMITTTNCQYL